jgi:hypothetical protein
LREPAAQREIIEVPKDETVLFPELIERRFRIDGHCRLSVAWLAEFVEMREERMGMHAKLISETLEFAGRAALSQRAGGRSRQAMAQNAEECALRRSRRAEDSAALPAIFRLRRVAEDVAELLRPA